MLREVSNNDINELYNLFTDTQATKYMGIDSHQQITDTQNWFNMYKDKRLRNESIEWCIQLNECDMFIGRCGYKKIVIEHNRAEISFSIMSKFWGDGLGHEMLESLIEIGFKTLHLHRIEAQVWPHNNRVRRLLEKNKFKYEGTLKDNHLFKGKYGDSVVYGLINQ